MSLGLRERVIHGVLNRLFQRRDIVLDGDLYLRRWFIAGLGTDCQVFLHAIRKPDSGRDLHDHPWDFSSRVVWGGYTEHVETYGEDGRSDYSGAFVHARGDEFDAMAEHTHRVTSVKPFTFTLVKTGPARRVWGFWRVADSFGRPHYGRATWQSAPDAGIELNEEDRIR